MFLYQGWYLHQGKETSFLTLCVVKFGLKATSLFKIWTPAWSSASTNRFHKGIFFSRQNGSLSFFFGPFFFFFFLPKTFSRFGFFHEQRSFHKQRAST